MDFSRGGIRPNNTAATAPASRAGTANPASAGTGNATQKNAPVSSGFAHGKLFRVSAVALLLSTTLLFIAMIFFLALGTPINREARHINRDQYQAVFINVNGTNGGQVYFGRIVSLSSQYIRLANVFYIQNQQSQDGKSSGSYNLVKLGCELHGPTDEMLINREHVFFWENLKKDSQVAQKAAEFYKQNPDGQKCATNSGSTQQSTSGSQQPAGQTQTPTTETKPGTASGN